MKNKGKVRTKLLIALVALFMSAAGVYAQADYAGSNALDTFQGMLTGNIGLTIGLGIMVLGLFTIVVGGKTAPGLVMIIGGALLTMSPGIFNGVRSMLYGVVSQFADGSTTTVDSNPSY